MVVDFQANSPIERAFTQAIAWETGRLWSEVSRNRQKENWDAFFGESFCLAYRCALTHLNNHLNTITTGMIDSIRNLNDQQKQSVFNVAIQVVEWTLEEGVELNSIECELLVRVASKSLLSTEHQDMNFLGALNKLGHILARDVNLAELAIIDEICDNTAQRVHVFPADVLTSEMREPLRGRFADKPISGSQKAFGDDFMIRQNLDLFQGVIEAKLTLCPTQPSSYAIVAFWLTLEGEIRKIELHRKSGIDEADEAALNAVKSSFPFPFLPERLTQVQILVSFAPDGPFLSYS